MTTTVLLIIILLLYEMCSLFDFGYIRRRYGRWQEMPKEIRICVGVIVLVDTIISIILVLSIIGFI